MKSFDRRSTFFFSDRPRTEFSNEKIEQLIEASRKNWAIDYKRKTESEVSVPVIEKTISTTPIHNDQTKKRNGFPESIR
jgi:uncharacterized protein (UPF0210 family)